MGQRLNRNKKRILLVANKNWEVTPLLNVLLDARACPANFPAPDSLNYLGARDSDGKAMHRAAFKLGEVSVEVWCIQDLMDPSASSSSTREKMRVLPRLFPSNSLPDFVIAFGTSAFLGEMSYNGCVVAGGAGYIYNPYGAEPNPESPWNDKRFTNKLLKPTISAELFGKGLFGEPSRSEIESRLLAPVLNPARQRLLIHSRDYVTLSVVNVTNYDNYSWADNKAVEAYMASGVRNPIGTVETTYSLLRIQSEQPFIFITGIADRAGYYNMEVAPRSYAQNNVASHNAAVATAWALPNIAAHMKGS